MNSLLMPVGFELPPCCMFEGSRHLSFEECVESRGGSAGPIPHCELGLEHLPRVPALGQTRSYGTLFYFYRSTGVVKTKLIWIMSFVIWLVRPASSGFAQRCRLESALPLRYLSLTHVTTSHITREPVCDVLPAWLVPTLRHCPRLCAVETIRDVVALTRSLITNPVYVRHRVLGGRYSYFVESSLGKERGSHV